VNKKKPSGDQIREMVATGFGRFHMESPLYKMQRTSVNSRKICSCANSERLRILLDGRN
jgi:hypothetical protein